MEGLIIRDAVIEDVPQLKIFEQELVNAERPFDPTIDRAPISYYDLSQYVKSDTVKVVVAQVNEVLVASGYAQPRPARAYLDHTYYAHLGFMYTVPEYRGQGINQKIIKALLHWAKENQLEEVRLTVYHENLSAVKAYEKVGFSSHLSEMRLRL